MSLWPEHDNWNAGWEESSWDVTSNWSFEPDFCVTLGISAWIACRQCPSQTMEKCVAPCQPCRALLAHSRKAWDLLNRVRNARGYYPIVRLAVPCTVENASKGVQKGTKTGKPVKGKNKNMNGNKRRDVEGPQRPTRCFICNHSGHLGRDCPPRGKGTPRSDSSHSPGFSCFAWA